jgi:hypothetical protein
MMRFESALPADMEAAITKWKNYKSAAHQLEENAIVPDKKMR